MGLALPEVMRRAFFQLRNGRPGPVQIEIPVDLFNDDVPDGWEYTPSYATRTAPDPQAVDEVATVLSTAERPVIYAGQGVHYAEAWPQLKALAEEWQIPVTTSLEGKSSFPENHEFSLGSGGRANPRTVKTFLAEADVIFGINCGFALTGFGIPMPRGKTINHTTLDRMELNKDVPAEYALIGDAELTFNALIESLKDRDHSQAEARRSTVAKRIATLKQEWLIEWAAKRNNNESPINPYRVLSEVHSAVDIDNTIITHDAGSPRDQLSPLWESTPLSYIG